MEDVLALTLDMLAPEQEMLSETDVAAILAPLLSRVRAGHEAGEAHGEITLKTVAVHVFGGTECSIHLRDTESWCTAAHHPAAGVDCAPEKSWTARMHEPGAKAADIWSIGVMALQLLLGRSFHTMGHYEIVDARTGEMPELPAGTSFECIDFLMDCVEPRLEYRATAAELLAHDFLSAFTELREADSRDSLAESLADVLLITAENKWHKTPSRPSGVPSLTARAGEAGGCRLRLFIDSAPPQRKICHYMCYKERMCRAFFADHSQDSLLPSAQRHGHEAEAAPLLRRHPRELQGREGFARQDPSPKTESAASTKRSRCHGRDSGEGYECSGCVSKRTRTHTCSELQRTPQASQVFYRS
jgi:hypothetical protein